MPADRLFDVEGPSNGADIEGPYRYRLWRMVNEATARRSMVFVMLNPSTADATRNDPTLLRCMHFARREGCGLLQVVNLYAWRTSKPSELVAARRAGEDIVGPRNAEAWADAITGAAIVVAAWGAANVPGQPAPAVQPLTPRIEDFTRDRVVRVVCLGRTSYGAPKHPLARGEHRIPDDQPLERWP